MTKVVDLPGIGEVEFPDEMTNAQITAAIQKQYPHLAPKPGPMAGIPEAAAGNATIAGTLGLPVKLGLDLTDLARTGIHAAGSALGVPSKYLPDGLVDRSKYVGSPEWNAIQMGRMGFPTVLESNDVGSALRYGTAAAITGAMLPLGKAGGMRVGLPQKPLPQLRVDPLTGPTQQQVGALLSRNKITPAEALPTKFDRAVTGGLNLASNIAPAIAAQQGYSPEVQNMAGLAPGLAMTGGGALGKSLLRFGTSASEIKNRVDTLRAAGITEAPPSLTIGSPTSRWFDSVMSVLPGSNIAYLNAGKKAQSKLGLNIDKIVDATTPNASELYAGNQLGAGLDTWTSNVKANTRSLYEGPNGAYSLIDPTRFYPAEHTMEAMDAVTPGIFGAPNSAQNSQVKPKGIGGLVEDMRKDINSRSTPGTTAVTANGKTVALRRPIYHNQDLEWVSDPPRGELSFDALKKIGSAIGENTVPSALIGDREAALWSRLYAGLARDRELAAAQRDYDAGLIGPNKSGTPVPSALARLKAADAAHEASVEQAKLYGPVYRAPTGEGKYQQMDAMMTGQPSTARDLLYSIPLDSARAFAGAKLSNMGWANPSKQNARGDVFSAETFLTNWNKMRRHGPESQDALISLLPDEAPGDAIGNIGRLKGTLDIAEWMRDANQTFANPSGTAGKNVNLSAMGGIGSAAGLAAAKGDLPLAAGIVGGGAAAMGGLYGLGRLGMSPWLQDRLTMPTGITRDQAMYMLYPYVNRAQ